MLLLVPCLMVALVTPVSARGATLSLDKSHSSIGVHGTANFTLSCTLGGRETSSGAIKESDVLETVHRLRILKSAGSKWTPVVEYDSCWDGPRTAEEIVGEADHQTDVEGNVKVVEVRWDMAPSEVGGEYMCELLGDSVLGQAMLMRSSTVKIDKDIDLTLFDLFELMKASNAKLDTALNDTKVLKKDVEKSLKWQEEFEEKNKLRWPSGDYGLLQPESGCPEDNGWTTGYIRHHTESSRSVNRNAVSDTAHMKKPIKEHANGQFYMTQHFCVFLDQTIAALILSILSGSGELLHALLYSCCAAKAARLGNSAQVFLKITLFLFVVGTEFFSGLSCLFFHLSKNFQDVYDNYSYGCSFYCALAATYLHLVFGLLMTVGVMKIACGFSRRPVGGVTGVPTPDPIHTGPGYSLMGQQQPMTYSYAGPQVEMTPPHTV